MNKYILSTFLVLSFLSCFEMAGQGNYEWAFSTNQYDRTNDFVGQYAIAKKGRLKGFINTSGQLAVNLRYNIIDAFTEGVASAGFIDFQSMESKSGYIDKNDNFTIVPQFEITSPFHEGIATVKLYGKWGYIDKKGTLFIPAKFEEANIFVEGYAAVKHNGKWGLIDRNGNFHVEPKFEYALSYSEGLACVMNDGKWGFIDKQGRFAIAAQYDVASSFSQGLAKVSKNGTYGFINSSGDEVIPLVYDQAFGFKEDLACVLSNGKWGYLSRSGEFLIEPKFSKAFSFSEQLARIQQNGKWGYIHKDGTIAIAPTFDEAFDFRSQLARVRLGNEKGYIRYKAPSLVKELTVDNPKARPEDLTRRAIREGQRISVASKNLSIKVYDHKKLDGDIVYLNYNGKWILRKYELLAEAKTMSIQLDGDGDDYLLLYAQNLGKEPPNTVAINISDGIQEQVVVLNADLKQCDIIYFDLK